METRVLPKGSSVRCYKCGSPNVECICHHCGRPMCGKHGPVKPRLSWFTENREFKKITLGHWPFQGSDGVHCEQHVHSTLNFRRIMIYPGIVVALVGLVVLALSAGPLVKCLSNQPVKAVISMLGLSEALRDPAVYAGINQAGCYLPQTIGSVLAIVQALLLLGFGAGLVVSGRRLNRENIEPEIVQQGITLPLGPATNRIRLVETLAEKITVDREGRASSEVTGGVQGELDPSFFFTSQDVKRIEEYREKYHIPRDRDLAFQAGYFILKGSPHLTPLRDKSGQGRRLPNDNLPHRTGMKNAIKVWGHVDDHPFFSENQGRPRFAWQKSWCYSVKQEQPAALDGQEPADRVPLWILPVLFERGDRKTLVLMVQLNLGYFPGLAKVLEGKDKAMAKRVWIERARLNQLSFTQFGQPQVENGICSTPKNEEGEDHYDVEWHSALFNPNGNSNNYLVFDGFQVSFTREIPEEARLEGQMVVRVPSLVSGVPGVQYYSALGQRASMENLQQELLTYLHVDFDIALARTSLPTFMAAPCTTLEEPGAPTPARLNQILDCFQGSSAERIFINRVVESQPQLGNESAEAGRWHWQLFGRRYCGILPIDFHIVIYGTGDAGKKGTTRIETSIMGTVDKVTEVEIKKTREKIQSILGDALKSNAPLENDHV